MSKTLVERLCQWAKADGAGIWGEAADRIEELEARYNACHNFGIKQADHIEELEAKLADRHERMDKLHKRNADLLDAWEDMDLTKELKSRIEAVRKQINSHCDDLEKTADIIEEWQDPMVGTFDATIRELRKASKELREALATKPDTK